MSQTTEEIKQEPIQKQIIHQIFTQFIKVAEGILAEKQYDHLDKNEDLSKSVRLGANQSLDTTLTSLASIARHCPKLIIDSIMIWRSTRKQKESLPDKILKSYPNLTKTDLEGRVKKANSLISNFILCRTLITILQNLESKSINADLGKKLEDMVFGQLRASDPEQTAKHLSLEANVGLFSELLGALSEMRFDTITDRFITEIREIKGVDRLSELKLEMIIKSMHYLKLKIYPMVALEETTDFLQALAELFQNSHSQKIKVAFCELFLKLLDPVARVADAEVNVPSWQKTIELITPKVTRMITKSRNLNVALPLMATLLCVSRKDYFLKNWPSTVETLVSKFKEKQLKSIALISIVKLVWVYLFRCFESPSSVVQKRIDYFPKVLFPNRHSLAPSECDFDHFVRVVYYILAKYPEYGNEKVIAHLLKSDIVQGRNGNQETDSFNNSKSDHSFQMLLEDLPNADRLIVAFRAFLLLMRDVEQSSLNKEGVHSVTAGTVSAVQSGTGLVLVEGKINIPPPQFPDFTHATDNSLDYLDHIADRTGSKFKIGNLNVSMLHTHLTEENLARMGTSMRETLTIINEYAGKAMIILESTLGSSISYDGNSPGTPNFQTSSTTSNILSNTSQQRRANASVVETLNSFTGLPSRQELFVAEPAMEPKGIDSHDSTYLRLLRVIVDSLPRFSPTGVLAIRLIAMLSRYTMPAESCISKCSFSALCRIAQLKPETATEYWRFWNADESPAQAVVRIYFESTIQVVAERHMELSNVPDSKSITNLSNNFHSLLLIWLDEIKVNNHLVPTQSEIDNIIYNIEGRGLLLLNNNSPPVREIGIKILKLVQQFILELELKRKQPINLSPSNITSPKSPMDRLSLFHSGRKASTLKKYSIVRVRSESTSTKPRISVYDIIVDQGLKLVHDNYFDPMELAGTRIEANNPQSQRKAHQTKLFTMEDPLIFIAQSSELRDKSIWNRVYPDLLKCFMQYAKPESLAICFFDIWSFLKNMHPMITSLSTESALNRSRSIGSLKKTANSPQSTMNVETVIEQWRLYLIFAYRCIEVSPDQGKEYVETVTPFKIQTSSELNRNILPFLSCDRIEIRKASVFAIGAMQSSTYGSFLDDIQPYLLSVLKVPSKNDLTKRHPPMDIQTERIRTELTHVLSFIANFVRFENYRKQDKIMNVIIEFIKSMIHFLTDPDVELEWRHQMTRYYFCVFIERFYKFLTVVLSNESKEKPETYISFKLRRDLFALFEGWCGYGLDADASRKRDVTMMSLVLDTVKDTNERNAVSKKMEVHKRSIQLGSLKAMASLCRGPLTHPLEPTMEFEVNRLTSWINGLLDSPHPRYNIIARTAIESILTFNPDSEDLFEQCVSNCYLTKVSSSVTVGYFLGLVDLISRQAHWDHLIYKIICLALYQMGSSSAVLRKGASRLLIAIDKKLAGSNATSNAMAENIFDWYKNQSNDDYRNVNESQEDTTVVDDTKEHQDITDKLDCTFETTAINSSIPAVYKKAQSNISKRLSSDHPDIRKKVVAELTYRIHTLALDDELSQCSSLLVVLAPWLRDIDLDGDFSYDNLDKTNTNTPEQMESWSIVYNMFYLTVRFGDEHISEIELCWNNLLDTSQLSTSLNMDKETLCSKRLGIIMDILSLIAISTQNPDAIHFSKIIAIYLCQDGFESIFLDTILSRLTPKSIIIPPEEHFGDVIALKCQPVSPIYTADMDSVLVKQLDQSAAKVSPGQFAISLLVDVVIGIDKQLLVPNLPLLLSIIFVQLDGHTWKCEELRLLLVNLIQAILPTDNDRVIASLTALNLKEGKRMWKYEDTSADMLELESTNQMAALAIEILEIFSVVQPNLLNEWAETLLYWGTHLPGSHVACRSLQIFRNLNPTFTQRMLSQLVHCLSFTISDAFVGFQGFSIDILLSLSKIAENLNSSQILDLPQLFWTTVGILSSGHECEYLLSLKLLSTLLSKLDMTDKSVNDTLLEHRPSKWIPGFSGLFIPLARGLQSSTTEKLSLELINSLLFVAIPQFLDLRQARFLYITLANMPRLLHLYDLYDSSDEHPLLSDQKTIEDILKIAEKLANASTFFNHESLYHLFTSFASQRLKKQEDFLKQYVTVIREEFPNHEWLAVKFSISLLSNSLPYYNRGIIKLLVLLVLEQSYDSTPVDAFIDPYDNWLQPLIALLDTPVGTEATRVLDVMLSGRVKSTEADITLVVGGAQNMYSFVKRSKQPDLVSYTNTGWKIDKSNDASDITKKRMNSIVKLFSNSYHPKKNLQYINQQRLNSTIHQTQTSNSNISIPEAIKSLQQLELFFRNGS
ncbi:cell morphogenesis N-terminal-domain-containing protein [Globomyces pollinis-pini]|nr:cell morphogenesis N-terminal-domain-containing protein [Globomyces pollinis-pini]